MAAGDTWGQAHINNTISFGGGVSCGDSFDPDYQAVLDYATTQGYTLPSAGQQTLQDQLVVDLKASGVWNKLDSFSVFATDGDANFALIDWKRLLTQTAVNSPSFIINEGYNSDGVSSYINKDYNPNIDAVNFSLNNGSVGFYQNTNTTGDYCGMGAIDTVTGRITTIWNRSSRFARLNDGASGFPTSNLTDIGLNFITRNNSTSSKIYSNGVLFEASSQASGAIPNIDVYTLAWNSQGTSGFHTIDRLSLDFIAADLSAEAADFSTAIQNYITAL